MVITIAIESFANEGLNCLTFLIDLVDFVKLKQEWKCVYNRLFRWLIDLSFDHYVLHLNSM